MKIIRGLENFKTDQPCAVTIGTFDGIHRGHRLIIEKLIKSARDRHLHSVLITFDPHPRQVLLGSERVKLLTTLDEKLKLLQKFDLDWVGVLNFDRKLSELPYERFVKEILLKKLKMRVLVIGYDHGFGKNRRGTYESLKQLSEELNFELYRVNPLSTGEHIIKSSHIRELLLKGAVAEAEKLLGHRYFLSGKVIRGRLLGKKLQFPTANLKLPEPAKLIPMNGVYAVDVEVDNKLFKGMLNIGYRPTFNHSTTRSIEVHIHDFSEDIYDKTITVFFKKRLRDEIKFRDLTSLKKQLKIDKEKSLKI
ncbi:MAG: bifunctional riboflavin kinase/FAD synthetase [Calditrichaeota bacterium]|nr:bifunctional riboflavin kinase/FAD synthetase [Calditrichota bacterium]